MVTDFSQFVRFREHNLKYVYSRKNPNSIQKPVEKWPIGEKRQRVTMGSKVLVTKALLSPSLDTTLKSGKACSRLVVLQDKTDTTLFQDSFLISGKFVSVFRVC